MSVSFIAESLLPTQWGEFQLLGFLDELTGKEHVVLARGFESFNGETAPLVRVHSECLTGDALFSVRCDCGSQLQTAMKMIAEEGVGAVLYLRQEGRDIGLLNKIKAYALQDTGVDTVEANRQLGFQDDPRTYTMCKDMLDHLGVQKLRLLTNNPRKVAALEAINIVVTERVSLRTGQNPHNEKYLATKKGKLGHFMD